MKPTITVYMSPTCGPCHRLIDSLNEAKIEFEEKDIINNEEFSKEFYAMGGQYTPTTIIQNGDEKTEIIGAQIEKIKAMSL